MKSLCDCLSEVFDPIPLGPSQLSEFYAPFDPERDGYREEVLASFHQQAPGEELLLEMYGQEREPLVTVGLSAQGKLCLGTPCLVWTHVHFPEWVFQPSWPIPFPDCDALDESQVDELLRQANSIAASRKATFLRCHDCGRLTIPESMDPAFQGRPTCHGCQEKHGVVH